MNSMMGLPHGEINMAIEENIVIITYKGEFNYEGVVGQFEKIKNEIIRLNGVTFGVLVDALSLIGGTPEAYEQLELFNQWLNTQAMAAKAMLIESNVKLKIIDSMSKSRKVQNTKTFTDREEAIVWLKNEINLY